jgi:ABC-type cobalamin/Fe3+-siderophores transport system ATPase subunit
MSYQLSIPKTDGSKLDLTLDVGQMLFALGANGTGKSSLMQRLNMLHRKDARWISAHRQNWFESDSINLSPQTKREFEGYIDNFDIQSMARWKDQYASQRTNIAIYELIEAENADARAIAKAARAEDPALVKKLAQEDAPIEEINELLKASNLPIELSVHQDEQIMAAKSGSPAYSIAHLSDGERNALLIAANVLTAKPGSLILVDEPERHLHRSIISPLLTQLLHKRKDCAFVVSTHDVLLPLDNPGARTLLIRGCAYTGADVSGWDIDLVPSDADIDDALKADILGSRKKILFVEGVGTGRSLDQPLYSLVFPGISVIAKSSCRDVEHAVVGVRGAATLHWIRAFGIVDSDAKDEDEIDQLKQQGIYAVPAYSVEALYYHPEIQRRVAARHAAVIGADPQTQLTDAKNAALAAIKQHGDRMSEKVSEKAIRGEVIRQIPGKVEIKAGHPLSITIDIAAAVAAERDRLNAAHAAGDLQSLITRYPVRETPALFKIAECLGFQDREQYEAAVLKLLIDDAGALAFVRSLFSDLSAQIVV